VRLTCFDQLGLGRQAGPGREPAIDDDGANPLDDGVDQRFALNRPDLDHGIASDHHFIIPSYKDDRPSQR
jgi:hypothetical protein